MPCHTSSDVSAHHVDIPSKLLCDLLQLCDQSLQVSEVWVVHEPIAQLEEVARADWGKKIVRATAKHYFLVFVLKSGQRLWDADKKVWGEYQYMRVERQQPVTATNTAGASIGPLGADDSCLALLNIRFCRDPTVVMGLDIPNKQPWELTTDDLQQYDITRSVKRTAQLQTASESWSGCILDVLYPGLRLGGVIKAALDVHNSKPTYSLSRANCMWFVKSVLCTLAATTHGQQAQALDALLQNFKASHRALLAQAVEEVHQVIKRRDYFKGVVATFKLLVGAKPPAFASQPADAAVLSKAAAVSGRLGSQGAVLATRLTFHGLNSSPYCGTQQYASRWHERVIVLVLLVLFVHKFVLA